MQALEKAGCKYAAYPVLILPARRLSRPASLLRAYDAACRGSRCPQRLTLIVFKGCHSTRPFSSVTRTRDPSCYSIP
ncbi:hypothetical protein FOZ60_016468 [Perkinsus olseni]|uniref:Uncharacterized protein n=1 Tax=Perkinsus olseni TaxID=32597 RepID=A0A7J6P4G4_PEROL|nr:hypothetical protein FOZ60_016468 [Perkinsus olseni]